MVTKAKRLLLSLSVMALFALYVLQQRTQPGGDPTAASGPSAVSSSALISRVDPTVTSRPAMTATVVPPASTHPSASGALAASRGSRNPSATSATSALLRGASDPSPSPSATSGVYADGSYTGDPADANWGTVQVQADIVNGQITQVQFLQHPDHRSRSQSINQRADPILIQEAIQSQQADVDIVTGATDTSDAFIQSLASALAQAAP